MSNLNDHIRDCNNDYGHIIVVEDLENELGVNMTDKGTNLYLQPWPQKFVHICLLLLG